MENETKKLDKVAFVISIGFSIVLFISYYLIHKYSDVSFLLLLLAMPINTVFYYSIIIGVLVLIILFFLLFRFSYNYITKYSNQYIRKYRMGCIISLEFIFFCGSIVKIFIINQIKEKVPCNSIFGCAKPSFYEDISLVSCSLVLLILILFIFKITKSKVDKILDYEKVKQMKEKNSLDGKVQ